MADNHLPDHLAAIEEAAQVLESAAAHNRAKGRTVLVKEQQDRADRLRAAHSFITAHRTPVADGAAVDLPPQPRLYSEMYTARELRQMLENYAREAISHYLRKQAGQVGDKSAAVGAGVQAWTVGNLLTMSDSDYPGMGGLFAQVWQGDDLIARVYGDSVDDVRSRAALVANAGGQS